MQRLGVFDHTGRRKRSTLRASNDLLRFPFNALSQKSRINAAIVAAPFRLHETVV